MTANYALWWFLRPSHLLFFLLVASLILLWTGRVRGARVTLTVVVGGFVVGGLLPLGGWLLTPLEDRFPERPLPEHVAGIVVLAGSEEPAPTAEHAFPQLNDYSDRLLTALLLARRYPTARLLHAGRTPLHEDEGETTTASDVAASLFIAAGLEPGRLTLESRSTNTCESAREVARLVAPEPGETWLLVTSAVHMPRAVACFRAAGLELRPVPVDFRQSGGFNPLSASVPANLDALDLAAHEWLGLAYYRVRGVTDELFPAP